MANIRMTEGVGRKIVDALKQQSEIEIQNVVENSSADEEISFVDENNIEYKDDFEDTPQYEEISRISNVGTEYTPVTFPQRSFKEKELISSELDDLDMPANVAVLKQLIYQLPSGVSKQTGAQIIKQTMEALGISMKNVLQEAQLVQDNLNSTSRECQSSIVEYKKQINVLERQSQKLQRQSASLNDIISLFVQTGI